MWSTNHFHQDVIRGAVHCAHERGWRTVICQAALDGDATALADLIAAQHGDAFVIQGVANPALTAVTSGRPVAMVTGRPPGFAGPVVAVDNRAAGRLAARHLHDRGWRSFAFVGWNDATWSADRHAGFHEVLADAGCAPAAFFINRAALALHGAMQDGWPDAFAAWAAQRPLPLAVLAQDSARAALVLRGCQQGGLRVPDDVAVLGIDDDSFVCETACPALSALRLPAQAIGREAALLALRLAGGADVPGDTVLLPPLGVIARASTDVAAVADPAIAAAMRRLRERWREPLDLADLAAVSGLGTRTLERRFRRHLGHSAQAELRRLRLEHARTLLLDTDRPIADIARVCGFADDSTFGRAFRRHAGAAPGALRARARHGRGSQPPQRWAERP